MSCWIDFSTYFSRHVSLQHISPGLIAHHLSHSRDQEEFQLALFRNSNKQNLFADRVFYLLDVKRNGVLLNPLHPNVSLEEKVAFAFQPYDLRQTSLIEREEVIFWRFFLFSPPIFSIYHSGSLHLFRMFQLKEMVLALLIESDLTLTEDVVETIGDKTFNDADSKGDGRTNVHQMAARASSHKDSGGLEEDIKVDSVGLQQHGSVEQEAEKFKGLLVNEPGVAPCNP
ncbi:hypothetical protein IFM89_028515 [Coptis chinensis]|uniref:Calcineurin B-like protein n=1 Tax=Coptis chinensis TaxID=261450 RepID=A0A835LWY9_9MAGN|nr:hypothetical protein IFM89_028515 [Coptis chinensis]